MTIRVLTGLTIVSGILAIAGHYTEPPWIIYVFKPLTTILILVIALLSGADAPPAYRIAILVGLVFSLAGDVLLMLPSDQFMLGLVSFLIAQICYIIAFTSNRGFSFGWASLIPVVIYGAIVYALLAPHLGKMRLPVIAYMIVILVMAWQAWERWSALDERGALLAFIGAALFVLSDTFLALNRFRGEFAASRALSLSTYYAAQWLITSSLF
ncbi:MAG TPA: lysoplasmalogenase [Anaerolineae bacterium]|nr:lysoplasmalogenase [Anaerolineae bacterium]